ncbi:MAG TPA: (2Fe-2S)-binding protein [Roseiflexaceae bacterium]|nr:(2Fe-2S)-binding protein [Roseiflexaceae bacterium]
MKLTINNTSYEVADTPERPLVWVLRDELGLTGTKIGCGAGFCGSCTVHVDGKATRSCQTPLSAVAGKAIRTVEGLATRQADGSVQLHPVQEAFIAAQAPQCAWCMNGQMMTALAFLEQNRDPSDDEIMDAMSRNFCRCGCYVRIKTAVRSAADRLRADDKRGSI